MKFLLALSSFLFLGFSHPFFVSMTDINYNAKDKSLEIGVRIFTDDLEKALRKNNPNTKIELLKPTDKKAMEKIVANYVTKNIQVIVNDKPVTLTCIGFESVEESIWSYYEVDDIAAIKNLKINNTLLYDYKKEQTNMVHIKAAGTNETRSLIYPNNSLFFIF